MIVGIDPGLYGCIAVIDAGPRVLKLLPLRVDGVGSLLRLIDDPRGTIECVVVERQHAMPRQGRTSIASQMTGYGRILGACEALGLSVLLVEPAMWKRRVGLLGGRSDADLSLSAAAPALSVTAQKRRILPHARAVPGFAAAMPRKASKAFEIGCADAVCLALVAAQSVSSLQAYHWWF